MLLGGKGPEEFDPESFVRAHDDVVRLTRRLPGNTVRVLADEVVKRLSKRLNAAPHTREHTTEADVRRLANALIDEDPAAWTALMSHQMLRETPLEVVYFEYLAPAARRLGELWDRDVISFAKVAVGSGRIYAIMKIVRDAAIASKYTAKYAVFASVPGEIHTLGVTMASDVFRQRGWSIDLFTGKEHDELVDLIVAQEPEVVGISASSDRHIEPLIRMIVALRVSLPNALMLVSGPIVGLRSDIVNATGTDFAAADLEQACVQLEEAWTQRAG